MSHIWKSKSSLIPESSGNEEADDESRGKHPVVRETAAAAGMESEGRRLSAERIVRKAVV